MRKKCFGFTSFLNLKLCNNIPEKNKMFCHHHKNQWKYILLNLLFLFLLGIGINWVSNKLSQEDSNKSCPPPLEWFEDQVTYKVAIMDFLDFSQCNSYSDCEIILKSTIDNINSYSDIKIESKLIKCRSIEYDLTSHEKAEQFCSKHSIDLLIYGGIETLNDSIQMLINFATKEQIETVNTKFSGKLDIKLKSLLSLHSDKREFQLVLDLIHWNLAITLGQVKNEKEFSMFKMYLNKISTQDDTLYYYSNLISALVDRERLILDSSLVKFNKAVHFKPNYAPAYFERTWTHLLLENFDQAASDILMFNILKSNCTQEKKTIPISSYEINGELTMPLTYSYQFDCLENNFLENKEEELAYWLLIQELVSNKDYHSLTASTYCYWKKKYPNSSFKPLVIYPETPIICN